MQARAEITLKRDTLRIVDVQHIVTWILGENVCPSWVFVKVRNTGQRPDSFDLYREAHPRHRCTLLRALRRHMWGTQARAQTRRLSRGLVAVLVLTSGLRLHSSCQLSLSPNH